MPTKLATPSVVTPGGYAVPADEFFSTPLVGEAVV